MPRLPPGKVSHATGPRSPHFYHWDPSPNGPLNVHPHSMPRRRPVRPPLDPRKHPYLSKVQQRWNKLSRRAVIFICAIAVAVIVVIVGVAVGLSGRHAAAALPLSPAQGPFTGDLTYYAPALGACGITSSADQSIVAISHIVFDAASTSSNPNDNPLCGKKIRADRDGSSIVLTVVDRCTGCKATDLDVSEGAFQHLADPTLGRVPVTWNWLESVPTGLPT